MRAILLASAAILVIGSAVPSDAADLAATPRAYRQRVAAYACPPVPGGVLRTARPLARQGARVPFRRLDGSPRHRRGL
jgi:hypothetical protein